MITTHSDQAFCKLPPRLDALTSAATGAAMAFRITGHRQTLFLDASDLAYISSRGVRTLRCLRQQLRASGGALVVAGSRGFAREVLILGGLGDSLRPGKGYPRS